MSNSESHRPDNDRNEYQAPEVESHLEEEEIEREVAYAGGTQVEFADTMLSGGQ